MLQFLSYIQSDSTNYIDSLYAPTINTELEIDIMPISVSDYWNVFLGRQQNDDDNTTFQIRRGMSGYYWYPRVGNGKQDGAGTFQLNTKYNLKLNKTGFTFDTTVKPFNTTTFVDSNLTIYFGGINRGGRFILYRGWTARFYECIIRESGTEVRRYKPALLDGVVGYWETHTETFLTPVGNPFIGGEILHTFKISPDSYRFNSTGETISATIEAETDWSFTNIPDWINVSPSTGTTGSTEVSITALSNTGSTGRNVIMTISDDMGYNINFTARQKAQGGTNNIMLGDNNISGIYIGDNFISAIYAGDNLIYGQ